jgi:hypothetical protein
MISPFRTALALVAAIALVYLAPVRGYQGMATPNRVARPAPPIKTTLPPITVDFRDIATVAGLTAENVSGNPAKKSYIIETTGNGVTIFDFDNDGLMDVFLPSGTTLEGDQSTSHLYRNTGPQSGEPGVAGPRFEDVTAKTGLARNGWAQGACAADYDNDGNTDLFVTYWGHSVLYRNLGNGKFEDVTEKTGLRSDAVRWDTGCSFVDYDLDGKLDLVVTGYVDLDLSKIPAPGQNGFCQWKGMPVMCGPRGLPSGRNLLFHNEGGKFRDVSEASGIGKRTGCYGFTAITSDFDNDGYPDIYVACDSTASLLYHNRKNGTFEEMGIATGAALNEDGQEQAGMGVAVADFDEDGYLDIAKTNFSDDTPNLYRNNRDGTFTDQVYQSGLGAHTQYLGWGIQFIDVDHDGRKDLLIVNGHVYPEVDKARVSTTYRQPRLLYWNVGGGKFKEITETAGPALREQWSSRGLAAGDLDNDGALEVVISNMGGRPSLLKNYGPKKSWLLVRCRGTKCSRDAVGARAYVYSAGQRLSGEVQTGTSFLSQNDPRLHFGLGDATSYDRIEVQWPGGGREVFPGGAANRIVSLTQGSGKPVGR